MTRQGQAEARRLGETSTGNPTLTLLGAYSRDWVLPLFAEYLEPAEGPVSAEWFHERVEEAWLFPGGQPGRPIRANHLGQRLKDLGIQPGQARSTALFQLATELPAALLARMLGIHIDVAVAWQRASSGDWMTYAADISRHRTRMNGVHAHHQPPTTSPHATKPSKETS